jgi:dienelactone hydrolase
MIRTKWQIAAAALLALGLMQGEAMAQTAAAVPFAERQIVLANGVTGTATKVPSARPFTYEDIIAGRTGQAVTLDAKLFLPAGSPRFPAVVIVPGSGGVNAQQIKHAQYLTSAGIGALLLDPFGGRGIRDTIADQGQMTFAESAYDVLAAAKVLAAMAEIEPSRIGAIGYSRGGHAVAMAAMAPVASAVLGQGGHLAAVVPAYPWCGYQFLKPQSGLTAVRFLVGANDDWVSPIQCQAQAAAMMQGSERVSIRLFAGAVHGFDQEGRPVQTLPDAVKALDAPIAYMDEKGVFWDAYVDQKVPGANDLYWQRAAAPFIGRGAKVGSSGDQPQQFSADMVQFFTRWLK